MKSKSVLLLGSYGQTNLGDDLLMWNYLELLRNRGFTKIYVNANTAENIPKPVQKKFPELTFVETYKTSMLQFVRLIRSVDVVVYGGGTLYKELYASTGRSPYSVILRLMAFNIVARLVGTKLYHLNIGIGSLKTGLGKMITKWALSAATQSIFRDQASYDFAFSTLGVTKNKIKKSTDGIFLNRVWEKPWRKKSLAIPKGKHKAVIGINVLSDIPDWVNRENYLETMREFVKSLLDDNNFVVFLPFQHAFNPRNDRVFTDETFGDLLRSYKNYKIIEEVPIDLVTSYISQCDVFVGMRFHSLLLCTVAKQPFMAITYDTKCLRFIRENDYDYAVELEKIDVKALQKTLQNTLKNREKIVTQLKAIAEKNYQEAEATLRKLPF